MVWLVLIAIIIVCLAPPEKPRNFVRNNFYKGAGLRIAGRRYGFVVTAECTGFVLVIASIITFCATQSVSTDIEVFWQVNQHVYIEAIELTEAAVIRSTTDSDFQLENMQHSSTTVDRIVERRDQIVTYNKTLALFRKWERIGWLVWPVVQYPNVECQSLALTGLR